jgi:hypothetical protein
VYGQAAFAFGVDTIWEARVQLSSTPVSMTYWAASSAATVSPDAISFSVDANGQNLATDVGTTSNLTLKGQTDPHLYAFTREGATAIRYLIDGQEVANHSGIAAPQTSMPVLLLNESTASTATYKWVRVRSYLNPEPALTSGAEETIGGAGPSQWRNLKIIAFRADAFDAAGFAASTTLQTTTGAAFQSTATLDVPAPASATDYLVIQSERVSGASSDTARKVGELRMSGNALLSTSHKITRDGSAINGYHHNASLAHTLNSAQGFTLSNGIRSPDGINVAGADSLIIVLRYPPLH